RGPQVQGVCASFESDYSPEGLQCLTNDDCAVPPVPFNNTLLDSCNDILPCTVLLDTDLKGEVKGQRVAWRREPLEVIYGRRERLRINIAPIYICYVFSCCRAVVRMMRRCGACSMVPFEHNVPGVRGTLDCRLMRPRSHRRQ
ncbi:hypothetical protein Vafri_1153, partial [Volvox africanus]